MNIVHRGTSWIKNHPELVKVTAACVVCVLGIVRPLYIPVGIAGEEFLLRKGIPFLMTEMQKLFFGNRGRAVHFVIHVIVAAILSTVAHFIVDKMNHSKIKKESYANIFLTDCCLSFIANLTNSIAPNILLKSIFLHPKEHLVVKMAKFLGRKDFFL